MNQVQFLVVSNQSSHRKKNKRVRKQKHREFSPLFGPIARQQLLYTKNGSRARFDSIVWVKNELLLSNRTVTDTQWTLVRMGNGFRIIVKSELELCL